MEGLMGVETEGSGGVGQRGQMEWDGGVKRNVQEVLVQ